MEGFKSTISKSPEKERNESPKSKRQGYSAYAIIEEKIMS